MHEAELDLRSCARVYMQGWKNIFFYTVYKDVFTL